MDAATRRCGQGTKGTNLNARIVDAYESEGHLATQYIPSIQTDGTFTQRSHSATQGFYTAATP